MRFSKQTLVLVWWLWEQVTNPAYYHAVFNRIRRTPIMDDDDDNSSFGAIRLFAKIVVGLVLVYILWRNPFLLVMVIFIPPIIGMVIIFLPVIAPIITLIYGMYLAMNIANIIKLERARHTYELVTATPSGALTVNWYVATGLLYRGQTFSWMNLLMQFVLWIPLLFVIVVGFIILLFFRTPPVMLLAMQLFFNVLIGLGAVYLSYMQFILVGMLVGLLIPQYDLPEHEVRFTTMFVYLAIQLGSYLVIGLLVVNMHNAFYGYYLWMNWLLPVFYFGIVYITLELVVRWLFRLLVYRLNASPSDLEIIGR